MKKMFFRMEKLFPYSVLFFLFITSVQAGVSFSPDTFSATLYPSETRPFSLFVKNTDSSASNITLTTQSANASCFLDNGLSFYSFLLSAQSNRTIHVFLQIPSDALPSIQQCVVTKTHSEPDPAPVSGSGGSGGGSGSACYYLVNGTQVPCSASMPVQEPRFCDVPASASAWVGAGAFMQRTWTITRADCSTTTFGERKESTIIKVESVNPLADGAVQEPVDAVPLAWYERPTPSWLVGVFIVMVAIVISVLAYQFMHRKEGEE